jgi:hypothetical protein
MPVPCRARVRVPPVVAWRILPAWNLVCDFAFCPPGEQISRGAVVTGGFATSERLHPPHLTDAEEATGYH